MRRLLLALLAVVLLLVATTAITVMVLGPQGLWRWALPIALRNIGDEQIIEGVSATQYNEVKVARLQLRNDRWQVDAQVLRAKIQLAALWRGEVALDVADVQQLTVNVQTPGGGGPPPSLPKMNIAAINVTSAAVQVDDLHVRAEQCTSTFAAEGQHLALNPVRCNLFINDLTVMEMDAAFEIELREDTLLAGTYAIDYEGNHFAGAIKGPLNCLNGDAHWRDQDIRFSFALTGPQVQIDLVEKTYTGFRIEAANLHLAPQEGRWQLNGTGQINVDTVGLINILIEGAYTSGGNIQLQGQLTASAQQAPFQIALQWLDRSGNFDLQLASFDLSPWVEQAPTRLDGHIRGSLDLHWPDPSIELNSDLQGFLLRESVHIVASGSIHRDHWRLRQVELQQANNKLSVRQAENNPVFAADFDLNRLNTLFFGLNGRIAGKAEFDATKLSAQIAMKTLSFDKLRLEQGDLTIAGEWQGKLQAQLLARNLQWADESIHSLSISANGDMKAHELNVSMQSDRAALDTHGQGGWHGDHYQAQFKTAVLGTQAYGVWHSDLLRIRAAADLLQVDAFCVRTEIGATLCLREFEHANGKLKLAAQLRALPLSWLDERLQGGLSGDAGISGDRLQLDLESSDATIAYSDQVQLPILASIKGSAPLKSPTLGNWTAIVHSPGYFELELVGGLNSNNRLEGQLFVDIRQLALLKPFLSEDLNLAGDGTAEFQLSGSLEAPRLQGSALANANIEFADERFEAQQVQVQVTGDGTDQLQVLLSGKSYKGDGVIQVADWRHPRLFLALVGTDVQIINRSDLRVQVSPDVKLNIDEQGAHLNGLVEVTNARLQFEGFSAGEGLSSDVTIVDGRAAETQGTALPLYADLEVQISNTQQGNDVDKNLPRVELITPEINARLGGRLRAQLQPNRPMVLQGHLDTKEGTFDAYGVRLKITRGRLDFNGSVSNPYLNARALRQVGPDQQAGVIITGPIEQLKTEVFAVPARPEADALAMLITGKRLAAANANELAKVSGASVALGLASVLPITETLRDSLSLDELSIEGPLSEEDTQIAVGKQITERFHARYAYSVFNRTGGLVLRYQVSDAFSLQTEAGAQTRAIDLLWQWQSK